MENLDYIDEYFKGEISGEKKQQFEKRIMEDASFADEVAFYISANGVIKNQAVLEKKQRFKELYQQQQKVIPLHKEPVKMVWRYMAAASVVAAVMIMYLFLNRDINPRELADSYIQKNWQTIGVKMATKQDSLQSAIEIYNDAKFKEALEKFEMILKNNPGSQKATEYAGITSLQLSNYAKALQYFSILAADTSYSNPGKFYKAITLLRRNDTGDLTAAKILLQQVIDQDLEKKDEAAKWMKKLD